MLRDRLMSMVRTTRETPPREWTVADLQRRFGPIPFQRIRQDPAPGTATEKDVVWLNDHENRLYELVDGVLVEKTVGFEESWLAGRLVGIFNSFVEPRNLGIASGADGMFRIAQGLVRIPDVAFVSWDRIPGGEFPEKPIPDLVPDLVVEVISRSNTRKEIDDKLDEYFAKGVRLVWLVRPRSRVVDVYTTADRFTRLTASSTLDGGDVLPGFSVLVAELLRKPSGPARKKPNGKRLQD
jgi:Uma2 family endonuclease